MDEIQKIIYLSKYDSNKTILEQTAADRYIDNVGFQASGIRPTSNSKTEKKDPCDNFVPAKGCDTKKSVCPGLNTEYDWKNFCWYVGLEDGRTSLQPTPTIIGVPVGSRVGFINPTSFKDFEYKFQGGDPKFREDVLKYSKNKNPNLFRQWISYFMTKLTELERTEYMSKYLIPPGSIYRINKPDGSIYNLRFELYVDTKPKSGASGAYGATNYTVKLRRKGYFDNQGKQYIPDRKSDLRSDFSKFVDEWGTTIQVVGAIGFAVAGGMTGGAAWAIAGEIAVELGMGGLLAWRAVEKGDPGMAAFEIGFSLLPLLKLSKTFAGVSDEVLQSTAQKYARSGLTKASTDSEILSFWRSLSDEEAKVLRQLTEFDEVNYGRLISEIKSLVNDPKKLIKTLLERTSSLEEAKQVAVSFLKSPSGKELGLTGMLIMIQVLYRMVVGNDLEKSKMDRIQQLLQSSNIETQLQISVSLINNPQSVDIISSIVPEILELPDPKKETAVALAAGPSGYEDLGINKEVFRDSIPSGAVKLYYFNEPQDYVKKNEELWVKIESGVKHQEFIPSKNEGFTWVVFPE